MGLTLKCRTVWPCLILLCLFFLDKSRQSDAASCSSGCSPTSNNVLKLQTGTKYVYNLEGQTETTVPKAKGVLGDVIKLSLKAKVEVQAIDGCGALINLKSVQVTGPDAKKHGGLSKLEQHPIRVTLTGGKLEPEICVDPKDDFTSINIKRSVASLLQADTIDSLRRDEVDVFGQCPTDVRVSKEGDVTVINRVRDLNKCGFREELRQDLSSISHSHSTDLKSTPLLNSVYESEQKIKGGVLEAGVVKENYLFQPFANRDNGVRSVVITKLTLESKSDGDLKDGTSQRASIIFENPHEIVTSSHQTVTAALRKVVDSNAESVTTSAARDFTDLVAVLRHASKDDLINLYGGVKAGAGFKNKQLAKKVFLDALFRSGSADSVSVAVELLKSKEIDGNLARLWYISFGFVRHASAPALASATTLLDDKDLPKEAYLGIGALAGQYCRQHPCENVPEYAGLLSKLASLIPGPKDLAVDPKKTVAVIKAIGKTSQISGDAAQKIAQLIKDPSAPTRIRAFALETARSDACRQKLRKAAIDVLNNREEDSELRIKAYLLLVECPTAESADKLSELIESETVNQVGAFITSHLRNLRASANPDRQGARALLGNVRPRRKFPFDARKFSQNHELSYNIDALNTAVSAESNVIFSQKSYLPRSVNLNLTTELFGHAFNLFEVSGRAENLERVVERYFGPKGYLKSNKVEDIYDDVRQEREHLANKFNKLFGKHNRAGRSVTRQQTDAFASKVKLYNSESDSNVNLDLSLRVLGNEVVWVNVDDRASSITPSNIIDKVFERLEKIKDTNEISREFKHHLVFLDSQLAYPTATGFPLRLTAVGSSVVHVKVGGNFDIAKMLKNTNAAEFKLDIIPSASVEVVGELTIDGYAVESGVKVAATLHTATGSEVAVKLLDGHGVDLTVGLPIKNSDLITITTDVLSVVKERGLPATNAPLEFHLPRKDFQGCFDQLQPLVGLTFCGEVGFPFDQQPLVSNGALYPLNGASKLSLRINKADESLKAYHLRVYFNKDDPKHRKLEIKIDTPGSKTPREIGFLVEAKTEPNKELNLEFVSPLYKFSANAALVDDSKEFTLGGRVNLDDTLVYKARLGLLINGATYTPVLEYEPAPGGAPPVKVEGTVSVEKKGAYRKFTFNSVKLITPRITYTTDGNIIRDTNLFQTDLKLGYDKHVVGVKTKFQGQGGKNLKVNAEIQPSQFPDIGINLKYEYQRDETHVENNLILVHGPDPNSQQSKLSFYNQIHYKVESAQTFDVSSKTTIAYPLLELEGRLEGAATKKSLSYDVDVAYGQKKAKSKLSAKTGITKPGDYEVNFEALVFNEGIVVELKRDVLDTDKSKFINKVKLIPKGGSYELNAEVNHQLRPNDINLRLNAAAKLPNTQGEYKVDAGIISNPGLLDSHAKLSAGGKDYLDSALKLHKSPASGSFKLIVLNVVNSNGEFKTSQGKGTGSLLIHVLPIDRKIKGSADLAIAGTKHSGVIEVLYDADKDNSKKLVIETDSDVKKRGIDSKNKLKVNDKTMIVNFHGESSGQPSNGDASGGFDVTFTCGTNVVGNLKQKLQLVPGNANGELYVDLGFTPPGGKQTKIFVDTYARNLDMRRRAFDSKFDAGYSCPKGDIKYAQTAKSTPQDGKLIVDLQNSLTGSHLPKPYHGKTHAVVSKEDVTFHTTATLGSEYTFDTKGRVENGPVRRLEHRTEIKTPLEAVKVLTLAQDISYQRHEDGKSLTVKASEELGLNGKTYKIHGEGDVGKNAGHIKASVSLPNDPTPSSIDVRYQHSVDNDVHKGSVALAAQRGDKVVTADIKADYNRDLSQVNVHLTGQTPLEGAKTIDIKVNHKRLSSVARVTDFKATINDHKLEGLAKVDLTQNHPIVDVVLITAQGKSRFYYKLDRKGEREASSEGQIVWAREGGGQLDFSTSVDLESYDNFIFTMRMNSEKLKINKLKLEVGNRPNKAGTAKRISFTAQTADKKGFAGSASYVVKENEHGFSIEGKGSININNENHPLSYKASYNRLQDAKETGKVATLVIDYTKGKLDAHYKITNKEFSYTYKNCLGEHCASLDITSKLKIESALEFGHEVGLRYKNTIDGRSDNFVISSQVLRRGLEIDQEAVLEVKDRKYGLSSNVLKDHAGVLITLPQRQISAVVTYELPLIHGKSNPNTYHSKIVATLQLDKLKKPEDKAVLLIVSDVVTAPRAASVSSEVKFSHPSLQKDLLVRTKGSLGMEDRLVDGLVELDVFNKKNQKISAAIKVDLIKSDQGRNVTAKLDFTSKGLNLDLGYSGHILGSKDTFSAGSFIHYVDDKNVRKDAGVYVRGSHGAFFGVVRVPSKELLKIESRYESKPDLRALEAEVTAAESKTVVGRAELVGWNVVKGQLYRKDKPNNKLAVVIGVSQQQVELKWTKEEGGAKTNLAVAVIKLDEANALKPEYSLDTKAINAVVEHEKTLVKEIINKMKTLVNDLSKELVAELNQLLDSVKKAQPNFKPLLDKYQAQLDEIRKELLDDPEFKKLAEVLQKSLGGFLDAIQAQIKRIITLYERVAVDVVEIQQKIIETYKKVAPELLKTFEKISQVTSELVVNLLELASSVVTKILEVIKANEEDIKKVLAKVGESSQEITRALVRAFNSLKQELKDLIELVTDQIKALPIYSNTEEKLKEFFKVDLPQQFWNVYAELTLALDDFLPSPELKQLAKTIFAYIEKLLKREQVDNTAEIKSISEQAVKAFKALADQVKEQYSTEDTANWLGLNFNLPLPSAGLFKIPEFGSIRFSPLSLLTSINEFPSLTEYIYTYRPTLNPLDYVPPYTAHGIVLSGHHFFTFDRRHYTFKGSCSYVLAQDFKDGNFSLIANLENGKLKSITLNDKEDTVELLNDNTVVVNGKPGDLPVQTHDIAGWRRYNSVNLKSKAGVLVTRLLAPAAHDVLLIKVSGFYFGRTRGLLGTIDNEQYDEYTLPNGHIGKDVAEFGNAYKVLGSCADVPEHKHPANHAAECTALFTSDSSLRYGFPYINAEIFREACDQHVAMTTGDKQKAACEVASAYVAALRQESIPFISLPPECVKCNINGQPVELGKTVEVQSPKGKADVVFVVEQSKHNEPVFKELVTPLITTLSHDLKEKGISDVDFAVIGFGGPGQKWPSHYGNHGKYTYDGKGDALAFGDTEKLAPPYDTLVKKIKYVKNFVSVELGLEQIVVAMTEANNYPFRQGAAKIIVLVNSSPCSKSIIFPFSIQVPRILSIRRFYKEHGLNYFQISPLANLALTSKPEQKLKNVVGFDSEKIYTLADAKKKTIEGDATDRPSLKFDEDLCLAFSQTYGGGAFSSQNFVDSKPDQKKKFVQVVSQRVVKDAVSTDYTEDCSCSLSKGVIASSSCKVSHRERKGR